MKPNLQLYMAEDIDFENHQISYLRGKRLSSESRDSHVPRDRRDLFTVCDSPLVALSSDTISLTLRPSVVEKLAFELGTNCHFRRTLTPHKSKTKPKFKNPARPILDIVP